MGSVVAGTAECQQAAFAALSADGSVRVTPWTGDGWAKACQLTVEFTYTLQLAQQFCGEAQSCRAAGAIASDIAREYLDFSATRQPQKRPIDGDVIPNLNSAAGGASGPPAQTAVTAGWQVLNRQQQAAYPGVPPTYATMASVFPTFDHESPNGGWDHSFSYVNFVLFPVKLDGQLYLAAVGHNGVGWREGSNILFAVYVSPGIDLTTYHLPEDDRMATSG